jgi:hypothetical protein
MIRHPLPFVVKQPKIKIASEQRSQRRKQMTLVAALSGHEGVAMFADNQEVVGGYSKKSVDKLCVYDFGDRPFRFAIAGATDDATYLDNLQSEIAAALLGVNEFNLRTISNSLSEVLTAFYSKHIWPRATDKPRMEFLLVVQPLPAGSPETFHISETSVNIEGITTHEKSIGIGSYLADYLTKLFLGGGEPLTQLSFAAVHIAREVRENIEGVGQVERVVMFGKNGEYDELSLEDIIAIEQQTQPFSELIRNVFAAATDVSDPKGIEKYIAGETRDMRRGLKELHTKWIEEADRRYRLLDTYKRRLSGGH